VLLVGTVCLHSPLLYKVLTVECRFLDWVCLQCPLLCKEFIIDAWQLYYARLHGADAVLLIAAVLPDQDLQYMLKIVHALGMAALIEVLFRGGFDSGYVALCTVE